MHNKLHVFGSQGLVGTALIAKSPLSIQVNTINRSTKFGLTDFNLATFRTLPSSTFREGDFAIILAAVSSPDLCEKQFDEVKAINLFGTKRLIAALLDEGVKVLFASSDAVYGEVPEPGDEKTACSPIGNYGKMKLEVEQEFESNQNFKSLRFSLISSPDDKFSRYLRQCATSKETASVFSNLHRSVIALDDVVEGVYRCLTDWCKIDSRAINFGGPDLLSRKDIAELFREKVDGRLSIEAVEAGIEFFLPRARCIALNSGVLEGILDRELSGMDKHMANWNMSEEV